MFFQVFKLFDILRDISLRTANWTVHHGITMALIFNLAYISIAHINFDASSWKILFYRVRVPFRGYDPIF